MPGAWMDMKGLQMNPGTALPGKIKELVGLAVSAQIPCEYCVYAHTEFAKLNGATDAEIGEAVVMGALTRRWSTVANGIQIDEAKFRSEIAQIIANLKKGASAGGAAPAKPMAVIDGKTALDEMKQSFGVVPEFLRRYPARGAGGRWTEMRDVPCGQCPPASVSAEVAHATSATVTDAGAAPALPPLPASFALARRRSRSRRQSRADGPARPSGSCCGRATSC